MPEIGNNKTTKFHNSMNAVFIIDKPAGLTSHDVVNRVRRVLGQRSVGHLGTLDPSATGVLPIVVGSFTRLAQFYMHSEKTYEGTIRFGFSTDTYDADGSPTSKPQPIILDAEKIHALAAEFQGTLEQVPPPFSAKKIAGVPAYKFARRQQEVTLKPVAVEIKEFTILLVAGDRATFYARVGSGTYIRSIAHDMGKRLRCGGHLAELRRTAVAEFNIEEACTLEELGSAAEQGNPRRRARLLRSPAKAPGQHALRHGDGRVGGVDSLWPWGESARAVAGSASEGLLRTARLLGYCYARGRNTLSSKPCLFIDK